MRILFVYPNIVESPKDISNGIATLSAVLKNKGHETSLIDTTFRLSDEEILTKAKSFNPDLIAITTATNDFDYASSITNLLRKNLKVPVIAGGFHPTIAPEEVISKKSFDMICVGEGEGAILDLVDKLAKKKKIDKVKNIWIKKGSKIIKNPVRPLIQDLDSIPLPDREIFDYQKYLEWNHGTATFLSTRGCPFNCSYCINHFLMKLYTRRGYVRFRSINSLFKEIKQVLKRYKEKVKNIEFYDDTFTLDEKRVREFCKRYPSEIGMPFNINVRVNAVNPKVFKLLKNTGCVRVSIGIESGDDYIRNKILKRNMSDQQIIDTFNAAKKAGLKTYSFNMIGIPFETKKSIEKTINLNRRCKPDYIGVSIFNAFKGTEIYLVCEKNNWLRRGYAKSYFRESNVKHPNFTLSQLKRIRNNFGFRVFISYRPLRAVIDLVDRNLSQIDSYIFLRSKIIEKLKLLRK